MLLRIPTSNFHVETFVVCDFGMLFFLQVHDLAECFVELRQLPRDFNWRQTRGRCGERRRDGRGGCGRIPRG